MSAGQQTSVSNKMERGFPGMISNARDDRYITSRTSQEASVEIELGVFVAVGADKDNGMIRLAAITDVLAGAHVSSMAFEPGIEFGTTGIKPKMTGNVMKRGSCFVWCEAAASPSDKVLIRAIANGGNTRLGAVTKTADAPNLIDASAWCRFAETTTAAGYIEVEFDVNMQGADPLD